MKTSYWFFLLMAAPLSAQVDIQRSGGRISVIIGGKRFTTLFCGSDTAKPYLHPLRSASGYRGRPSSGGSTPHGEANPPEPGGGCRTVAWVSTRGLIFTALLCGLAILVAFAVQVTLLTR